MRRLPIFFVLDCSESMVGENIQKMEEALQMIVRTLRTDPHALETAYISVIAFAGIAKSLAPLVELVSFYPPKLPLGSGTSLGDSINVLMNEIDSSVVKTTADRKGDWRPIVYLITDGKPTDNFKPAFERWKNNFKNKATMVAVAVGKSADHRVLQELTDNVFIFENSHPDDFKKFVTWITASVAAQSKSICEGSDLKEIIKFDPSIMKLAKDELVFNTDESCAIFVGRCQKSTKPYLIKYDKRDNNISNEGDRVALSWFDLSGCYPISEEYFEWSTDSNLEKKVNTTELVGFPGCPHCGNLIAFGLCQCGQLLCLNGPGKATCPWCKEKVEFGPSGNQGMDISRRRG